MGELRQCKSPDDVFAVFQSEKHAFDLPNCAAALHALVRLQHGKSLHKRAPIDRTQLAELAAHAMTTLDETKHAPAPRTLSQLAWGLARLGVSDERFLLRVAAASAPQAGRFNSVDMGQMLFALAQGTGRAEKSSRSGVPEIRPLYHGGFLKEAAPRIARLAPRMKEESLVGSFVALSKIGYHDDVAIPALERELLYKQDRLSLRGMVNAVGSAHRLGRTHSPIFDAFAPRLTISARKLEPRALSQVLWAYTQSGRFDLPLIKALLKAARHPQRAEAASPRQLATIAESLVSTLSLAKSVPFFASESSAV